MKNEIKILRMLDSEYLVKMEGMFESSSELIILMELLSGGTLYTKFRSFNAFSEKQAAIYIHNIL
jgi:serine/threonine protein kinase